MNPSRPVGLGYETCLPKLTDINSHTQDNHIRLIC